MIKRIATAGSIIGYMITNKHCSAAESDINFSRNATCIIEPVSGSDVKGLVSFSQTSIKSPVMVASSLRGLIPNNVYTLLIHQSGETTKGEEQMGDPYPKDFMLSMDPKSKWDLQTLVANYRGTNYVTTQTNKITLYGEKSIVGRAIAVRHLYRSAEEADKKGKPAQSLEATGIIGLTRDFLTLRPL